MNDSEEHILNGCLAGDPAAQRTLYRKYAAKMLGVCKRYVRNTEEAEDILQEAFITVFEKLTQYKGLGSFEGWIRRIVVHRAIEYLRKNNAKYTHVSIDDAVNDPVSSEDVLASIASKDLLEMILELPPVYKMVFNLYVFEGFKHREISDLLGISEGTSKSNLSGARAFLKKRINRSMLVAKTVND